MRVSPRQPLLILLCAVLVAALCVPAIAGAARRPAKTGTRHTAGHHRVTKHKHRARRHHHVVKRRRHKARPAVKRPLALPPAAVATAGLPAPPAGPLTGLLGGGQQDPAAPAPAPAQVPAATVSEDAPPFAPTSFWNTPLAADAPLDDLSATYVADIRSQLTTWLPWINTTKYSSPVYTVPADAPTTHVTLDKPGATDLQAALDQVPIPAGAVAAAGSDATMVVWQPATDTLWELWQAQQRADGWHAAWGGRMTAVSSSPGYYSGAQSRWGATASSLPVLGGLIRISELRAGHIDHALALALPQVRAAVYSWPAQRTDGTMLSPDAIPEGTRLRLDPTLDLSRLSLPPVTRMIAEAAQRYGIVVRDRAGSIAFYAEDPTPTGSDPYSGPNGFFGGMYPSKLLAGFPWGRLQALRTALSVDPY